MGYQDRDYYRDESSQGNAFSNASVVMQLIVLNGILYLANILTSQGEKQNWLADLLALDANSLTNPLKWWQYLTYGFTHSANPMHVIGNMLGLYFFGQPLENRFGRWEFLRYYLLAIVFSGVVWSISEYSIGQNQASCIGASGAVAASVILYCLLYPRATILVMFAIPAPAWVVGILFVGLDLFQVKGPLMAGSKVAFTAHLGGAAFAVLYWSSGINFGRLFGLQHLTGWTARLAKGPQPDLKIHDPEQYYDDLDAEADRVLEKLHRDGESSLSPRERRVLEDYARRMRQKRS